MGMKKAGYMMLFLAFVFIARAELVDDFESYDLGLVNDVTTDWVAPRLS